MECVAFVLLSQLPVFLCRFDIEGKIRWCNLVTFGWSPKELEGKDSAEAVDEPDRPQWRRDIRRVVGQRENVSGICHSASPGGRFRMQYRLSPIVEGGAVTGVWSVSWVDEGSNETEQNTFRFTLSRLGHHIVGHLLATRNRPMKGTAIGRVVGEVSGGQASQKLRVLLGNLTERGILTHSPDGYAISKEFLPLAETNCRPLSLTIAQRVLAN